MYRIYQFGSVALPPAMPEDDLSTGAVDSTLVDSIGGTFDALGATTRLPRRQIINLRGMYEITDSGRFTTAQTIYLIDHSGKFVVDHAGNKIVADYSTWAIRRNVDLLRQQIGTRQALYRKREHDSVITWKTARLLRVGNVRTIDDAGVVAQIEMVFDTLMTAWRANTLTTVGAIALPAGLTVTNTGKATVTDAILSVTATSAISSVRIVGLASGIDLTWTGTLGAGSTLVIDAGAQTVRIGSTDYYSGLVRNTAHTAAGWLPIPTGTSSIVVSAGGVSGTATITYYEQYL